MPALSYSQTIVGVKDFQKTAHLWGMMIDSPQMHRAYNRIIVKIRSDIRSNRVPVDTGFLRASVYGEVVIWAPVVEMRFGARAPYASYVHDLHKTKSQFISSSMEAHGDWVREMLADAVRKVFRHG